MKKFLIAWLLIFSFFGHAKADILIQDDQGGYANEYIRKYIDIEQKHEKVVIDGFCVSACTLITVFVDPDLVCIKNAKVMLGFHSYFNENKNTHNRVYNEIATKAIFKLYPENVKKLILESGWNGKSEHPIIIGVPATKIYKICH